jgi:CAAX protease family protein
MAFLKSRLTIGGVEFDLKLMASVMVATLLPMVYRYGYGPCAHFGWGSRFEATAYDQLLLFFVIPIAFLLVVCWENPLNYGLGIGKWKEGLIWTVSVCAVLAVVLLVVAKQQKDVTSWYKMRNQSSMLKTVYLSGVEMFAWEYFLRGFLLFALARAIGPGPAIVVAMVPFALLHMGKVPLETFSTVFSGIGFGFVAWRTQSFLYCFLIHWFMLTFIVFAAAGKLG